MNISTLLRRLVMGSFLRACNLVLSAGVAFFMLPFLVSHLGTRDYGLWILVGTIMGYHLVMDFGLSIAVSRFYSQSLGKQDYEKINNIISSALFVFFGIGLLVLGAVTVTSTFTSVFLNNPREADLMSKMLIIIGIAIATQFPLRTFGGILLSVARHDLIVLTELYRLVTRSVLVVYFIMNGHGILTLALITLITELTANFMEYKFARSQAPFIRISKDAINISTIKQLFSFGWVAFINETSNLLRSRLLPLIVAALLGVEMVVVYTIALRLLDYFEQLVRTTFGITMPIFSQLEGQERRDQIREGYKIVLTIVTIITVFIGSNLIFLGKPFILMWMGKDFELSYTILTILTVSQILFLIQVASEELLYGMSKHMYNAVVNLLGIGLSIILSFILNQKFPQTGIALGFAIGIGTMSLTIPWLIGRLLQIQNIRQIYFKVILGTAIKLFVPIGIYFYFISSYVESTLTSLIFWGFLEFMIIIPVCYLLFPQRVKEIINDQIRSILLKRGFHNVMS